MKYCPTCKRTFTDPTLGFCIEDGTPLVPDDSADSQATAIFNAPPPTAQMPPRPTEYAPQPPQDKAWPPAPYGWSRESGQVWTPPPPPTIRESKPQSGMAIASMILGLVSVTIGLCCYVGVLTAPVAMVLGFVALSQIKKNPEQYSGKPMAIVGIVSGALYFVILVLIILLYGLAFLVGGLS